METQGWAGPPSGVETTGVPARCDAPSVVRGLHPFAGFYALHQAALRNHVRELARGVIELDDAVQEGYIRVLAEFDDWAPLQRVANAKRAMRFGVIDAIRREHGVGKRRRPIMEPCDLAAVEAGGEAALHGAAIADLGRAFAREAQYRGGADAGLLERSVLADGISALGSGERDVLLAIALEGHSVCSAAERLGLTRGQVRYRYEQARRRARSSPAG